MHILYGFLILIGLQFFGDILSKSLSLPVPGSVIGMLILLLILIYRGRVDTSIAITADGLIKYIGLLFSPAGAGISLYLGLIAENRLMILLATGVSTMFTLMFCAVLFKWLSVKEKA